MKTSEGIETAVLMDDESVAHLLTVLEDSLDRTDDYGILKYDPVKTYKLLYKLQKVSTNQLYKDYLEALERVFSAEYSLEFSEKEVKVEKQNSEKYREALEDAKEEVEEANALLEESNQNVVNALKLLPEELKEAMDDFQKLEFSLTEALEAMVGIQYAANNPVEYGEKIQEGFRPVSPFESTCSSQGCPI